MRLEATTLCIQLFACGWFAGRWASGGDCAWLTIVLALLSLSDALSIYRHLRYYR